MKKKILLSLLVLVSLFTIVGCSNKSTTENGTSTTSTSVKSSNLDKENSVKNLYFKYSSKGTMDDTANGKRIRYEGYSIIVSYQEGKTIDEIANEKGLTFNNTRKINKVKWQAYDFTGNVISTIYMYERDNGTYVVTFARDVEDIDIGNDIEEFMNEANFK